MSLFWKIREKVTPIMTSTKKSSSLMSLPCRFELQGLLQYLQCLSNEKGPQPPQPTSGFHNLQFPNTKITWQQTADMRDNEVWTLAPRSLSNKRTPSPPKTCCNGSPPKASSEGQSAMLVGPLGWPGQKIVWFV